MSRALIVIDPQQTSLDDSAIMVHINRLLAINWDVVVLTSDGNKPFHRSLHQCAVSEAETMDFQVEADEIAEDIRDADAMAGDWACRGGGGPTAAMLTRAAKEIRIYKDQRHDGVRMPCFSAFDGVGVNGVTLEEQLKARGVTEVWICGLCHEIGIQSTAQDAVALGFRTLVVHEACRIYVGTIATLKAKGVERGAIAIDAA